jgi:hypothetical protein
MSDRLRAQLDGAGRLELVDMYWDVLCGNGSQHEEETRRVLLLPKDMSAEAQAKAWVGAVVGVALPDGALTAVLRSGEALCDLVNVMRPGIVPRIHRGGDDEWRKRQNVSNFLEACVELGLHDRELFAVHNFLNNRMYAGKAVVRTLHALARMDVPGYCGPRMGSELPSGYGGSRASSRPVSSKGVRSRHTRMTPSMYSVRQSAAPSAYDGGVSSDAERNSATRKISRDGNDAAAAQHTTRL